jgi:hypothetical protein
VNAGILQLGPGGTLIVDQLIMEDACGHFVRTGGTLIQRLPPILGAGLDADGDGLPNGWEQSFGLDALDPSGTHGPNGDADGDGQSNLTEYQAGTNPTDSASAFQITAIAKESDNIRVTWMTTPNKTNALERTTGSAGSFSNNFVTIFTATNTVGSTTNYLDLGAATSLPAVYYRVRLVP